MRKKGQEMSISTLVIIVIAIVVLVLIVVGFSMGWQNLLTKLNIFAPTAGIADVVSACKIGASAESTVFYCNEFKKVKIDGKIQYINCQNAAVESELDSKLSCTGNPAQKYCDGLKSAAGTDANKLKTAGETIVNGVSCSKQYSISTASTGMGAQTGIGSDPNIRFLESSERFKVLTAEECRKNLDERKKSLEIPSELCYWKEMVKIYDEKCDNLNEQQVLDIFKDKESYRNLNNLDWPSLSTKGDFCVPIIYDCAAWLSYNNGNVKPGILGFVNLTDKSKIYINPFLEFDKNIISYILIHEGLHIVQSKVGVTIFGEYVSASHDERFMQAYPGYKLLTDKTLSMQNELIDLILKQMDALLPSNFGTTEYFEAEEKLEKDMKVINDILSEMRNNPASGIQLKGRVSPDNGFYSYITTDNEFTTKLAEFERMLKELTEDYLPYANAWVYVSNLEELDPRLSEVNRWWLDKTAPNCEIIKTPERASAVLNAFLSEKDIADEYAMTQKQLIAVMDVAEKLNRKQEIYNRMVNRIPGLAYNVEGETGTALA